MPKMLEELTPTQLESLALDLLQLLGLKNCVWRTPGRDGGRDIQGDAIESDFSGYTRSESWYVDCKRYAASVSWPTVWEKLAYAESNNADVLLIVTTSNLSPQAVDEVNRWNTKRNKPTVRFWNGTELERRIAIFPELLVKYGISTNPIADAAIALLPLNRILMKYTNSALAAAEFEAQVHKYYEVTHAVSELISARLEEVERSGRPSTVPFRVSDDSFSWLPDAVASALTTFDRCATRALVTLLRCHGASPLRADVTKGRVILTLESPFHASARDLESICLWGSARTLLNSDRTVLELFHD